MTRCWTSRILLAFNLVSFLACLGFVHHLLPALASAEARTAYCNSKMHHAPICALPAEAMQACMVFLAGCAFVAFVGLFATLRKNKIALGFYMAFMFLGVIVDLAGMFYILKKLPARTSAATGNKLFVLLALYTTSHGVLAVMSTALMCKWKSQEAQEAKTLLSQEDHPHDVAMEKASLMAPTPAHLV